jgi:hypothetical protein
MLSPLAIRHAWFRISGSASSHAKLDRRDTKHHAKKQATAKTGTHRQSSGWYRSNQEVKELHVFERKELLAERRLTDSAPMLKREF